MKIDFKQYFSDYQFQEGVKKHNDERLERHILAVQLWGERIDKKFPGKFPNLMEQVSVHDQSKKEEPEYSPYILITHRYKMKRKYNVNVSYTKDEEDLMYDATFHHIKNNKHHPEYYDSNSQLNRQNRDEKPNRMVDATPMDNTSIAEMCADWISVSRENGNTAKNWADRNINIRWKFTEEQVKLIYDTIKIEEEY